MVEHRYRALRILIWIYWIIAIVIVVFGLFAGFVLGALPGYGIEVTRGTYEAVQTPPQPILGISVAVVAIIIGLTVFAFGELLHLLVDLEENTRETARHLRRVRNKDSS